MKIPEGWPYKQPTEKDIFGDTYPPKIGKQFFYIVLNPSYPFIDDDGRHMDVEQARGYAKMLNEAADILEAFEAGELEIPE